MRYESKKTAKGNIGVSSYSQELADAQAAEMDANNCTYCTYCTDCTDCVDCVGCVRCVDCVDCVDCVRCVGCVDCVGCDECVDCVGCVGCVEQTKTENSFTEEKKKSAIAALDVVAEIILSHPEKHDQATWHATNDWVNRDCGQELACGTSHCLAGWLQVCSTDPRIRSMSALNAGASIAPMAAKMFFKKDEVVRKWLEDREYAK